MSVFLIILAIICFAGALVLLFRREVIAPAASLAGLTAVYFSDVLPLAGNMLITWVALTVIVIGVSVMQPVALMQQRRGVGYMLGGALTGMAVGLMAVSSSYSLTLQYACMIIGVLAGIFFGFFMFTRTPRGRDVSLASGYFFTYLSAKGFPVALTVIQPGVALMLRLATI